MRNFFEIIEGDSTRQVPADKLSESQNKFIGLFSNFCDSNNSFRVMMDGVNVTIYINCENGINQIIEKCIEDDDYFDIDEIIESKDMMNFYDFHQYCFSIHDQEKHRHLILLFIDILLENGLSIHQLKC